VLVYSDGEKLCYTVYDDNLRACLKGRIIELKDYDVHEAIEMLPDVACGCWGGREIVLCCCNSDEFVRLDMIALAICFNNVWLSDCCNWGVDGEE